MQMTSAKCLDSVLSGDLNKVKETVAQGADVNLHNNVAIYWAANNGHLEIVKYLLEQGADPLAFEYCIAR